MANDLKKVCIEFTEKILKGYRELKLHLEELKRLKETLKCEYTTQAITYDKEKISPKFGSSSLKISLPNNIIAIPFTASFFLFLSCLSQ
ncbi:hypothetical protein [Metaclostridioides mangenotii]|uniref:Uncharacterized protein n=1 Tax=Metaclostridioides mangenotii TaxID=1540 RepID=A0ABS4EDX8_9FIRM|nr:hypothetical protein [Clostridioides mangenotii]MBP1856150.1 hypothetical protein [Clostridioides mangenotii]